MFQPLEFMPKRKAKLYVVLSQNGAAQHIIARGDGSFMLGERPIVYHSLFMAFLGWCMRSLRHLLYINIHFSVYGVARDIEPVIFNVGAPENDLP